MIKVDFLNKLLKKDKQLQDFSNKDWLKELDWANVYHDSIRGKEYLTNLSLNIGRWAGNYAFFYLLNRVLHDFKPKKIVELGLGESSKFVSSCIDGINYDYEHTIVEQNENWSKLFQSKFSLSKKSEIFICPMVIKQVKNHNVNMYSNLLETINPKADLYIVDGPHGSPRYSRYDICQLAEIINSEDEFIIMLDDCQRVGEMDTFLELAAIFERKHIKFFTKKYKGVKTVIVIASEKYKYATTL